MGPRVIFSAYIIPTISARQFETAKTKNYPAMTLSIKLSKILFSCAVLPSSLHFPMLIC